MKWNRSILLLNEAIISVVGEGKNKINNPHREKVPSHVNHMEYHVFFFFSLFFSSSLSFSSWGGGTQGKPCQMEEWVTLSWREKKKKRKRTHTHTHTESLISWRKTSTITTFQESINFEDSCRNSMSLKVFDNPYP